MSNFEKKVVPYLTYLGTRPPTVDEWEKYETDNAEDRNRMRGSKYIQSKLGDTFKSVKTDLDAKKSVLFSGTSCQVAGLKKYIGKEYDNLFCVDIVCHGVPSKKIWEAYLRWQEQKMHSKVASVDFRNKKDFGWHDHVETLCFENGKSTSSRVFKEGFKAVHEYLVNGGKSCMAGFVLKNTLSDNGGVTRGICKMDDQNNLTEVVETKNIVKTATGAEADGVVVDVNSLVSMNMWGLTTEFLDVLEEGFKAFFEKEVPGNPLKAEYLIPIFIGELLEQGKMSVKVLKTNDTWYGMTYHEDVAAVKDSFKKMLEDGVYKADLFSDL